MKEDSKFFQSTPNCFFPNSEGQDISSVISAAKIEHFKWHHNDGCGLFVFGALFPNIPRIATIPVSTSDSATAFTVARSAVRERNYSEEPEWILLYEHTP
jgi:hypothetical protein